IGALSGADLILYNGLHLEAKLNAALECLSARIPIYPVTQYISGQRLLAADAENFDPHVWMDVSLWHQAVDVVRDALVMYDPMHAEDYRLRAVTYGAKLDALNEELKTALAALPTDRRVLVTAHDGFRYFGRAYGLEVRGVQGISTENAAGMQAINSAVDYIVQRNINAVFPEGSTPDRDLEAVIEACRARGHSVRLGPELFADAMASDSPSSDGINGYLEMMRHNASVIVTTLK
ncbi:MAG TPA: zinc ABC transporter substrate-binding protein, partial [Pirellulales bacterium]